MRVPLIFRIGALVLATTGFYTYVGQMVPQKEVQAPQETVIKSDLTTADMVKIGREIMEGKGLCLTCHTIGKSGALRFPDLAGVDARARSRVAGLSDIEYFAQSMYEPTAFVVPGFPPAMPPINRPPIGLTDQEILCVIAYLQTLGGTPTVTLQTKHHYNSGAAPPGAPAPTAAPAPGGAPAGAQPEAAPTKGTELRPDTILKPVAAHQMARLNGPASATGYGGSAEPSAKADACQGEGGGAR
jgi:Cytochrome c